MNLIFCNLWTWLLLHPYSSNNLFCLHTHAHMHTHSSVSIIGAVVHLPPSSSSLWPFTRSLCQCSVTANTHHHQARHHCPLFVHHIPPFACLPSFHSLFSFSSSMVRGSCKGVAVETAGSSLLFASLVGPPDDPLAIVETLRWGFTHCVNVNIVLLFYHTGIGIFFCLHG